jgi:hypothetical protein
MTHTIFSRLAAIPMLALALSTAACTREQAHRDAEDAKDTAQEVGAKTDEALGNAAHNIKENTPSSDEIKNGINNAGDSIKDAAKTVERKALEARQDIRKELGKE